jgi:hypothetical protein
MRVFNFDAIETIHSAWKISQGEKIYVDFDQPHHPGLYFFLAPISAGSGGHLGPFLVIAHVMLVFTAASWAVTEALTKLLFDKHVALKATIILLALPWFALSAFVIRADVPMLCFELGALFFFYKFLQTQQNRHLIYSAICISIAFIFLQKAVFFAAFIGVLMLKYFFRKKISWQQIALYNFVGSAVQALFWLFLSHFSSLSEYIFFSFTLVGERQTDLYDPAKWMMIIDMLSDWQVAAPVLLAGICVALVKGKKDSHIGELGFGALGLLATVLIVGRPYEQYYLPAMPLVAIIFAVALSRMKNQPFIAHILFSAIMLWGSMNYALWAVSQYDDRQYYLDKLAYVLDTTHPDEPIYDGSNQFNIFRNDLDFFWYGGDTHSDLRRYETYQKLRPYSYDIYDLIDKKKPKIISHYFISTTEKPWILWRYKKNDRFNDIYELIPNETGFEYWTSFQDSLNTGSTITPRDSLLNAQGHVHVKMKLGTQQGSAYPYVGLDLRFMFDRAPIDLSTFKGVEVTYVLKGEAPIALALSQPNMASGHEHQINLLPSKEVQKLLLTWEAFKQPSWVQQSRSLNPEELTGIKLKAIIPELSSELSIHKIEFIKR